MEEKLVSKIDNEIPDCWPLIEDTELLNISSTKMRSVLKG